MTTANANGKSPPARKQLSVEAPRVISHHTVIVVNTGDHYLHSDTALLCFNECVDGRLVREHQRGVELDETLVVWVRRADEQSFGAQRVDRARH